jgi:copper chaperone NosL
MKTFRNISRSVLLSATALLAFVPIVLIMAGCKSGPRDISFGKEHCEECSMTISDHRFAAEVVTKKGRRFTFDAIECMAAYLNADKVAQDEVESLWVMDFHSPGSFIDGAKAYYLQSDAIQSPMRMHLAAFPDEKTVNEIQVQKAGRLLRWTGVRLLVAKEWE